MGKNFEDMLKSDYKNNEGNDLNSMGLKKPIMLMEGDKVATISLSWGGAGDENILWRYEVGKKRLQEDFGLQVIEMKTTLKGTEYVYNNPEERAKDLMEAFKDPSIKGIVSCIGGDESIRILPYIDYEVIRNNPKIFIGYSDSTVTHFICMKAGICSFYGPAVLSEFAENIKMFDYTKFYINRVLFTNDVIGNIRPSEIWTSEHLPWEIENKFIPRKVNKNMEYELLQGSGKVQGHLIGGCIDVLEMLKGTEVWPSSDKWKDGILFLETSEDKPEPTYVEYWLRNYGAQGILQNINGIVFGKPYDNVYYNEYKEAFIKVIRDELKLKDLPILFNVNFGHTAPMITIPYGAKAEIDCEEKGFSIIESGVRK